MIIKEVIILTADKLVIRLKGEDGYKTFSIRIKDALADRLDEVAAKTERSRNEVIGMLLEYGLENLVIEGIEDKEP